MIYKKLINSLLLHRANQKLKSIIGGKNFLALVFCLSFHYFHIAKLGNKKPPTLTLKTSQL